MRPSSRLTRSATSPVRTFSTRPLRTASRGSSPSDDLRPIGPVGAVPTGRRSSPFAHRRSSSAPGRTDAANDGAVWAPSSSGSLTTGVCATSARSVPGSAPGRPAELLHDLEPLATTDNPFVSLLSERRCQVGPLRASRAGGRGRIRRMDHGRPAAPPHLARPSPRQVAAGGRGGVMAPSTRTTIEGRELSVSNLDKVLFPQSGLHQGSAHRLLRARRPGDAAPPP